jgi:hypothetical protein
MPNRNAGIEERGFKRERTTDEERDEVVSPQAANIRWFVDQLTVPPHAVPGDIRSEIGLRGKQFGSEFAWGKLFQQWTGLRIATAEFREIRGKSGRNNDQVQLRVAGRQPGRRLGEGTGSNRQANTLG